MLSRMNLIAFIVACVLLSGFPIESQTPASPDEASIRQVVQQVQDGWNAHDARIFAAPFTVDADYVIVNGMRAKGRADIEKGHAGIFSTIYKESHNVGTVQSIRFLRPDVAVAHIEWNLEFKIGGETKKGHAMNTMVLTKDAGKWSIAVFQNTPIEPPRR